VTLDIIPGEF